MPLARLDVYVAVSDLDRATEFYTRFFETDPVVRTPTYSGFDLGGALFGLFDANAYPPDHPVVRGNSTVANIFVTDVDAEHERVASLGPRAIAPIFTLATGYRGFVFADPDGNVLELYEEAAAGAPC